MGKLEPFIKLKNVYLYYPIVKTKGFLIKDHNLSTNSDPRIKYYNSKIQIAALENINLNILKGEIIGIVGGNGSGKTSFLKVLSKALYPSSGELEINGKISSILELNFGLNKELTGKENIEIISLIHGVTSNKIEKIINSVINFADLGEFINFPVRTYSSGMQARLTFGIVTILDQDILLVDEVIGVGDAQFRLKAENRFNEIVSRSGIVIIASHNENIISSLCNRILKFKNGKIIEDISNSII